MFVTCLLYNSTTGKFIVILWEYITNFFVLSDPLLLETFLLICHICRRSEKKAEIMETDYMIISIFFIDSNDIYYKLITFILLQNQPADLSRES